MKLPSGKGISRLSSHELAERLSYLTWSSLPDEELSELARRDALQDPATLRAQVRRMLRSPKIDAFATEFFGQWLRYRDLVERDPIQTTLVFTDQVVASAGNPKSVWKKLFG